MTDEQWDVWLETKRGKRIMHLGAVAIWFGVSLVVRWLLGYEITVLFSLAAIAINVGVVRSAVKR